MVHAIGFPKAQDAINKEAEHLDRAAHGKMSKAAWRNAMGLACGGVSGDTRFCQIIGETAIFFIFFV